MSKFSHEVTTEDNIAVIFFIFILEMRSYTVLELNGRP